MSTVLTTIAFVKSVSGSKALSGTATARLDDDEYVDFRYKAFNVNETNLIDEIQENTIMLFAGKYIFEESQLFILVIKSTLLDLKTIDEKPTIYDLPISPLFGVITAPCVTPSKNQDDKHYFTMSRKIYDPFKSAYTTIDVPCFYDPNNGCHSSVASATNGKAIFTVAGEVFLGRKLVQVIASEIEWTYSSVEKANNDDEKKSPRKALKSRRLDFEEKFMSSNSSKGKTTNYAREPSKKRRNADHGTQEESSTSRTTKLTHAMNVIVSNDEGSMDAVENSYNVEDEDEDDNENETVINEEGDESCDTK